MIKKSNRTSIRFTNESITVLQIMGYLDKVKKSKGRNLSKYISRLVLQDAKITYPIDYKQVKKKVKISEINELSKQRDSLDTLIQNKAKELKEIKDG